ncbi:ProQ/FINO family protein [Sinorhizobium fredii]|uniref:ProQ/FINO family protein n=1 Tax=Rhizobium fredii TaxID=380 RepID=UPI0013E8A8FE|nr:ProQ/FINO family protein [Sinorhizobium fredii]
MPTASTYPAKAYGKTSAGNLDTRPRSTDNNYSQQDPSLKGARSSRNPGAQSSRNKGAASSESAYLAQLRAGATRVDLAGDAAGEVTEADAATARAWLQARFGMVDPAQSPRLEEEPAALAKSDLTQDGKVNFRPVSLSGLSSRRSAAASPAAALVPDRWLVRHRMSRRSKKRSAEGVP